MGKAQAGPQQWPQARGRCMMGVGGEGMTGGAAHTPQLVVVVVRWAGQQLQLCSYTVAASVTTEEPTNEQTKRERSIERTNERTNAFLVTSSGATLAAAAAAAATSQTETESVGRSANRRTADGHGHVTAAAAA